MVDSGLNQIVTILIALNLNYLQPVHVCVNYKKKIKLIS